MIGVAFFAAPFVWITILTTHLAFRRATARARKRVLRFAPPGPWSSLVGITALLGVLVSTWWVPSFHITLLAGGTVAGVYYTVLSGMGKSATRGARKTSRSWSS
jgi:L-asparagine transporter-like permease